MKQFIAITGRKSNGKDTLGNYLVKNYGYKRISFADPIKEICKTLFKFNNKQLNGSLKETKDEFWNVTPREVFQYVGTDLFRYQISTIMPHIENNFWIAVMKRTILKELEINPQQKFVITDLRFQNEFDFCREMDCLIIRVSRSVPENQFNQHESEIYIDTLPVDACIENNSSLEDLYKAMRLLLNIKEIDRTGEIPFNQEMADLMRNGLQFNRMKNNTTKENKIKIYNYFVDPIFDTVGLPDFAYAIFTDHDIKDESKGRFLHEILLPYLKDPKYKDDVDNKCLIFIGGVLQSKMLNHSNEDYTSIECKIQGKYCIRICEH